MEEILNPEVQETAPVAEVEVAAAEVEAPAVEEKPAKKAVPATKKEVIERLKEIAADASNAERSEIDLLKQIYYKIHNAEAAAAREEFISKGGAPEDFMPAPDNTEAELKTKLELGTDYGMAAYGAKHDGTEGAVKEWNEQAAAFDAALVGKTSADFAALAGADTYATGDLATAGCTMAIGDMIAAATAATK